MTWDKPTELLVRQTIKVRTDDTEFVDSGQTFDVWSWLVLEVAGAEWTVTGVDRRSRNV